MQGPERPDVKKIAKHEPKALEQLENERNILRFLNHENIVALVAELPGRNLLIKLYL